MPYRHTQHAPISLILLLIGLLCLAAIWSVPEEWSHLLLAGLALLFCLLAASFHHLTVEDEGEVLCVRFGPVPLFQRRLRYVEMERATRAQTNWYEGWGIHMSPGGGWVWNLWGFDCVDVDLTEGRRMRIGTNDPQGLEEFLVSRIREARGKPEDE